MASPDLTLLAGSYLSPLDRAQMTHQRPAPKPVRLEDWTRGLAMASAAVPGVGDVAGAVDDVVNYSNHPEEMTPGNLALSLAGIIPAIPSLTSLKQLKRLDNEMLRQVGHPPLSPEELNRYRAIETQVYHSPEGGVKSVHPDYAMGLGDVGFSQHDGKLWRVIQLLADMEGKKPVYRVVDIGSVQSGKPIARIADEGELTNLAPKRTR